MAKSKAQGPLGNSTLMNTFLLHPILNIVIVLFYFNVVSKDKQVLCRMHQVSPHLENVVVLLASAGVLCPAL